MAIKKNTGAAAAVAIIIALAGCSSEAPASTVDLPDEQSSTTAPAQPETDWANVKAFLAAQDAPGRPQFTGLVAPGSPAERWTEFATDLHEALVAAGEPSRSGTGSVSYQIDEETGTVTHTTTYSDGSPDEVLKLTKWVTDQDGRIVSYADENGVALEDRLWTQEPSGAAVGETVQVVSAYRTSSGYLTVNIAVTTDGEFTDWDASYVGPDGIARKSVWNTAGTAIKGATNLVTYSFEQAPFGGKFIYNASGDGGYVPITLVVG